MIAISMPTTGHPQGALNVNVTILLTMLVGPNGAGFGGANADAVGTNNATNIATNFWICIACSATNLISRQLCQKCGFSKSNMGNYTLKGDKSDSDQNNPSRRFRRATNGYNDLQCDSNQGFDPPRGGTHQDYSRQARFGNNMQFLLGAHRINVQLHIQLRQTNYDKYNHDGHENDEKEKKKKENENETETESKKKMTMVMKTMIKRKYRYKSQNKSNWTVT